MIADHVVVMNRNRGGSQNNVIAASNNLLKTGGGKVNISGTPAGAEYALLTDDNGNKG